MEPKSEPPAPAAGVAAPKRLAVVGAAGVPKGFEAPGVEAAKGLAIPAGGSPTIGVAPRPSTPLRARDYPRMTH